MCLHLLFLFSLASWAQEPYVIDVPSGTNPPIFISGGMPTLDQAMANLSRVAADIRFDRELDGFVRVGSKDTGTPNSPVILISRDKAVIDAYLYGQGTTSDAAKRNPPIQLQLSQRKINDCSLLSGYRDGYELRAESLPYGPGDRFKPVAQTVTIRMCVSQPPRSDGMIFVTPRMKIYKGSGYGLQARVLYGKVKGNIADNTAASLQNFFIQFTAPTTRQKDSVENAAPPK